MSYDLSCYRLKPGAAIEDAANADMPEEGEPDPRPIRPLQPAELFQTADEIVRLWSGLERFDDPGHFELTARGGVQFMGFPASIAVHIAYWHEEQATREGLKKIWAVLGMLERQFGLATYDPQLGKRLDLQFDFDDVLKMIGFGTRALRSVTVRTKPWWKFW